MPTSFTGESWALASSPDWETGAITETIDLAGVLPADEVTIEIGITAGFDDGTGENLEGVLVTGVEISMASDVADPDSEGGYTYDAAGRMDSRTIGDVTTTLTWDVLSSLVSSSSTDGDFVYGYDGSGQRVVKITLDPDPETGPGGKATAYLGSTEITDSDTSSNHTSDPQLEGTSFVTATRFYTFGGASVAVRDGDTDTLSLLLGDSQGSAQVMMQVALNQDGSMQAASTTDPVTRNAYLPYGATRGGDNLTTIEHGWLNQVTDESDTGLIYLNARYYDPILSRFLSPDPLMSPGDPRTLVVSRRGSKGGGGE